MKNKEIKATGLEELKAKVAELRKNLIKLNAQVATGTTLKSPGEIKQSKKTIAKMLTAMKEKRVRTKA